jgi:hypothetical protein
LPRAAGIVLPIVPSLIRVFREFGAARLDRPARAASFDRLNPFATNIVLAFANHIGALIISGFTAPRSGPQWKKQIFPMNWLIGRIRMRNGFPDDVQSFGRCGSDDRIWHIASFRCCAAIWSHLE